MLFVVWCLLCAAVYLLLGLVCGVSLFCIGKLLPIVVVLVLVACGLLFAVQ